METFDRREFIKVVGQSAAGLLFGFSQMQGCTKREGLLEAPDKAASQKSKTEIVDAHCHLFNAQYAIMEYVAARWNCCWGNYPHKQDPTKKDVFSRKSATFPGITDYAAWIAQLLYVATSNCATNYNTEKSTFEGSTMGQNCDILIAPLMMDIYFMLDDNRGEEKTPSQKKELLTIKAFHIPEGEKNRFKEVFADSKKLIRDEFNKIPKEKGFTYQDDYFNTIFDPVEEDMLIFDQMAVKGGPYNGIELSPGYLKHMHDLEEVSEKCPGKIFPFLAVDPRRIGIQKLIEMKINKGNGVFKGIKLYPPLGYLPTHPDLDQIYKYCEQHQIPITVHCSDGGIKNFKGKNYIRSFDSEVVEQVVDFNESGINKSRFYAAPNNWKFVLSRYPELRINFAHFGGGDNLWSGDSRWMEDILNLTAAYENVYTDFSYYTKPELADKIGEIVQRHPVLNNKLMFGTDFIMILLDHDLGTAGGLREYFTRFSGLDRSLLCGNAKRFLKI